MSSPVAQADSTYTFIEKKIRRLTASASQAALSSDDIAQAVNTFYNNDFPYAIKIDQQRVVYKFLTIPNVDRYPVDVNNYQGFRAPVYFEGIQGNLFKNRDQLYNLYPRYPAQFQQGIQTISGVITNISNGSGGNTRITSENNFVVGGPTVQILINNVEGATELNGNVYTVISANSSAFVINLLFSTLSPYTGGGSWTSASANLSFNLFGNVQYPFPQPSSGILSTQVVIGGIDINGNPIRIIDDGGAAINSSGIGSNTTIGQLLYIKQNAVGNNVYLDSSLTQQPAIPDLSPLGGQQNANLPNTRYPPSPLTNQYCGTVNYISTQIDLTLPITPMPGTQLNIWAAPYQVGRPYNLLFWNNEFTIRPVPDNVYLVEVEAYQTPSQFMNTNNHPILNQWAQYIAYGAACEILRDRQDAEGVSILQEGFKRQEALVLERQSIEEIGQPNITLFNSTQNGYGYGLGWGIGNGS